MRVFEKLIQERDEAWEERKELLMKMKRTNNTPERDKLFKRYMDLGFKVQEIQDRIKFTSKDVEAEIKKNGVIIKFADRYSGILIPFDVFERIVEWYQGLTKEVV